MTVYVLPLCAAIALSAFATQAPEFRSTTSLVHVNVIVTGKRGPVLDLQKDDFVLLDRGKPRPIRTFLPPAGALVQRTDRAPAAGEFSNALGYNGTRPASATVVLLDCLNTTFRNQVFARREVIAWLKQVSPRQQVALYLLGKSLHVVHDFTNRPEELIALLARLQGEHSAQLAISDPDAQAKTGIPELDAIMEHLNGVLADRARLDRGRVTLRAMESIADHVSGVAGRKNLIWVSGGFPFSIGTTDPKVWQTRLSGRDREMGTFQEQSLRVTRLFSEANIAIYPVDAGGLAMSATFQDSSRGQAQGQRPFAVAPADQVRASHDTMEELAMRTGGRAFYNSNDLSGAMERAVADSDASYTLGFYPEGDDLDGKFHELVVSTRRDGTRLRFRRGYVAYAENRPAEEQRKSVLRQALGSPLPATGIDLTLRTTPRPGAVHTVVTANARQVAMERNGERLTGRIEAVFAQQDASGAVIDLFRAPVSIDFSPDEYAKAIDAGLILQKTIQFKDKTSTLRIVVQDCNSGSLGSLIVPLSRLKQP